MSVKLMSAIFETEFRDLPDEDGNITKASTAKLVLLALADHANDEGEGAYPGLTKMERKTALSRQTVINTYGALKHNGIIFLAGISKRNTNNYTINTKAFPKAGDDSQPILLVNPLDSTSQAALLELVNPLDPNHPLTINESSSDILKTDEEQGFYSTAYRRGEQAPPDKIGIMLDMERNYPGAVKMYKVDTLLSRWSVAFLVKTTAKDWRKFAEYAVDKQNENGWEPDKFIEWVKKQEGYPTYWSRKRMEENYPKAFTQDEAPNWQDRSHPL